MRTEMTKKWMWIIIFAPLGLALFVAIGGWVVMALWNWLLPTLFGWPEVTFWQALGILALSRILFGGFGAHGPNRSGWNRHKKGSKDHLTDEERGRLKQGIDPVPGDSTAQ